ncbi:MAG: tetratricopeptide repeat protein [bacterium]
MKLKIIAILAGLFLIGTFFMPGGSSVNVKNLYEEAEKAFQEKKYQEAIDKYLLAIEEGKKFGANTKVIDEDFDNLAKFKIATAYTELGKQLDDPTKYEESLKLIPEIYANTKTNKVKEGVIFLWGINLYQLERYEEAEPKFRELINDFPDSRFLENSYYTLGRLYYDLKQYESSREAFKKILTDYKNSEYIDDAQFFIARCFFDEANYDQSHIEFEKVESENKDMLAQARYYNALSLLRMGRNQEALTAYQQFVGNFPESPYMTAAYFDIGTIHSRLREYEEATRNYQLAIQNAKDDITRGTIQFEIGNNYYSQEDYQSAVNAYKALMDNYPSDINIPEARFMIAESYWALKDYQNALQAYNEVLEKDPNGPHTVESIFKIGECNYQLGNKELSLEWYDRVINEYPDSPIVKDATYSKLWALHDLRRYDEVERVGREYIEKYKKDPIYDVAAAEAQTKLGDIKFEDENYIAAADEYLKVVAEYSDLPKFDPFKSRALLQAGISYYQEAEKNNFDESLLAKAADAYSRLIDMYERKFDKSKREFEGRVEYVNKGIINLGLTYSKLKQFDKATEVLGLMPKNSPDYGMSVFVRGQAYIDAGRPEEAIALYRQMVNDKSISESWRSRAAVELASKLREDGKYQEAIAEYQRILQEFPNSEFLSMALYYIGSSYYDIEPRTPENLSKAIEAFQQVVDKFPQSETAPWSHLGLLMAYDASGDYNMVIKTADEIEMKYSDSTSPDAKRVIDAARRQKVDTLQKMEEGVSTDTLISELRKIATNPIGDVDGKAAAQMRIGTLLFNEKRYAEAITEFETLIEKFPGKFTGAAYYQIAASAFWLEDYPKAIDSARRGLEAPDLSQEVKVGLNYTLGLAYGKVNDIDGEIEVFKAAIQAGENAETEQIKQIAFSARRELARLLVTLKRYDEAVAEYQYLAENSTDDGDKAEAHFWLAKVYEDNLQDYQKAVDNYEQAKALSDSEIVIAQSLYFEGVLYSRSLKNDEKALDSFMELVSKYSNTQDENIKMMVMDANIRIPDLLIKLGRYDDALKNARAARDAAFAGDNKEDKINSQYQLANLLGDRASKSAESGSPKESEIREAVAEFIKVYDIAKPVNELPDELKPLVAASIYNAGHLLYTLSGYDNYAQAVKYFELFLKEFPKNENYSAVLQLLAYTTYEMARLKADLAGFERAAQYFARFAKEFPNHKDAASSMFQAGEAYYAVGGGHSVENRKQQAVAAWREAINAYRAVVDRWPKSEFAPDALYAMAACHNWIAEATSDNKELDKMTAVYRELAEKYPNDTHAAAAFEAVGNSYYNQAAAPNLSSKQKSDLFKKALDAYKQGLRVPGIDAKTKSNLEAYVRETEELLAKDTYEAAQALVPYESADIEKKKANAPRAIALFNEVINNYPDTDYADLSHVQIGLAYEILEQWENAEKAYTKLIAKYTDKKGNPITPFSENVVQAVQFARQRKSQILAYRMSLRAREQSQR